MLTDITRFIALTLCLLFVSSNLHAQEVEHGRWENGIVEGWWFNSDKYTPLQAATARSQWQIIEKTVKASRDEWTGDYQIGVVSDVRMKVLRWSPESGFVFFNINACAANVDEVEYGEALSNSTYVELSFSKKIDAATPATTRKFVKVKWGNNVI